VVRLITLAAFGCSLFCPLFNRSLAHNLISLNGGAGAPPQLDEFPQDLQIRVGIGRHGATLVFSHGVTNRNKRPPRVQAKRRKRNPGLCFDAWLVASQAALRKRLKYWQSVKIETDRSLYTRIHERAASTSPPVLEIRCLKVQSAMHAHVVFVDIHFASRKETDRSL
jgi:hypothetical protein